jgi:hypothetical protein
MLSAARKPMPKEIPLSVAESRQSVVFLLDFGVVFGVDVTISRNGKWEVAKIAGKVEC